MGTVPRQFRIAIGAMVGDQTGDSFEHEVELVKASLLYGDAVTLTSNFLEANAASMIDRFATFYEDWSSGRPYDRESTLFLSRYFYLVRALMPSDAPLQDFLVEFEPDMTRLADSTAYSADQVRGIAARSGLMASVIELGEAARSGRLAIHNENERWAALGIGGEYALDVEEMLERGDAKEAWQWFRPWYEILTNPEVYPLLNPHASRYIHSLLEAAGVEPPRMGQYPRANDSPRKQS